MDRVGHDRWKELLAGAGLPSEAPRLSGRYPDKDLVAAVGLLADATDKEVSDVLCEFGRALFPALVATYGDLIPAGWRTLDLIEHTEGVIHRAVRLQDAEARPPRLTAVRTTDHEVRVLYSSPRRLCSLARGLLTGAAEQFGDGVTITEERCVERGDPFCEFVVSAASASATG